MLIKSVRMKNIRSYTDGQINFPEGSMLLSGDIGSGKSTVLLAIDFALFGISRHISGAEILRHGSNSGFVELGFELDGSEITIRRCLRRMGSSVAQDSGQLSVNGMAYDYAPGELTAKIYEMLGYPYDSLRKDNPIFRYTVYTPQEEMKHILLYPEERLKILRKLFDIDKYGRVREDAHLLLPDLPPV